MHGSTWLPWLLIGPLVGAPVAHAVWRWTGLGVFEVVAKVLLAIAITVAVAAAVAVAFARRRPGPPR